MKTFLWSIGMALAITTSVSAQQGAFVAPGTRDQGFETMQAPKNFFTPTCTTSGLPRPYERTVANSKIWVFPLATIQDGAMDDDGTSSSGDSLRMYCVGPEATSQLGLLAVCLTGEACPWR